MSMVSFVTFQNVPFFKDIDKTLGKTYMYPSWKFMLEYMISYLEHLNIFTFLFGHVCCQKISLKFLPLLMPKILLDQIVFVWGCKQCIVIMGQFAYLIYYYLKDFDRVHLVCRGLPYGNKDQTLFIDDEPSKALWNPKWSKLFLESFRGRELLKKRCNG